MKTVLFEQQKMWRFVESKTDYTSCLKSTVNI